MEKLKRLPDAELEVMLAVWSFGEPVSASRIQEALRGKRDWALASLMTVLGRLCTKGYLSCSRQTRPNLYTALIAEEVYKQNESRSRLERLYGNSVQSLVASLVGGNAVGDEELAELRAYLDCLEVEK